MGAMKKLNKGNNVLYGYPTPPWMEDIVNLVLIYDKIYDFEDMLKPLQTQAKNMAQYLSGTKSCLEEFKGSDLSHIFAMIYSISEYHGVDIFDIADPRLEKRILWLDDASSTRKADHKRAIKIIDDTFKLLDYKDPHVAEKVIETLNDLSRLFEEGIIISRESLMPEILQHRGVNSELVRRAKDMDMEDDKFVALALDVNPSQEEQFTSLWLNDQLITSSYWGIPLHMWDHYLPLIEYKYTRGASYTPELTKKKIIQETFSMVLPEVYALDITELLAVRNSSEFRNLRREIDKVYTEAIETFQHSQDIDNLGEYFKTKYWSQIEHLALDRRPKPGTALGTMLIKNLISTAHPLLGLVPSIEEVYHEYEDRYKTWRFAVSVLDMKAKMRTYHST